MSGSREAEPELTARETAQVERANGSSRTPVVFIHGLWALSNVWDEWAGYFEEAGYIALDTRVARRSGDGRRGEGAARCLCRQARRATRIPPRCGEWPPGAEARCSRPFVWRAVGPDPCGPQAGGGVGRDQPRAVPGCAARADFHGAVRAAGPTQSGESPARGVAHLRAVPLLGGERDRRAGGRGTLRALRGARGGRALFQDALANINPWTDARVDSKNPARGPLLIIAGAKDRFIPSAVTRSAYKRQRRNGAVTEFAEFPGRGHSLTIDAGWREVAETALDFIQPIRVGSSPPRFRARRRANARRHAPRFTKATGGERSWVSVPVHPGSDQP